MEPDLKYVLIAMGSVVVFLAMFIGAFVVIS